MRVRYIGLSNAELKCEKLISGFTCIVGGCRMLFNSVIKYLFGFCAGCADEVNVDGDRMVAVSTDIGNICLIVLSIDAQ